MPTLFFLTAGPYTWRQGDVATCHTTKYTKEWRGIQNLCIVEWPENSPDCHGSKIVKTTLLRSSTRTITRTAVGVVSTQVRVNLMKSMPLRFEACIEAKGDVIKCEILAIWKNNVFSK